jgi:protein-S-isoprenylcysteine O-methyltransferase Ste14
MSTDNAGVKFPPPFIFLLSILIGLGLQRFWPMSVVPATLALPLGVASIAFALVLVILGFRELRRHKTTIRPDEPSSAIVKTGPYRFTRNPLYVSLSALQLGIGLWTNILWVVVMLIPVWIVMTTQVIAREEAYLERAFGEEYSSYKASVRRWI